MIRVLAVLFIPLLLTESLFTLRDKNVMTAGKKKMEGKLNVASSKRMKIKEVKDLSKKLGCTVNDLFMSAVSSALKDYFRIRGDKVGKIDDKDKKSYVNAIMPVNIRWEMYPTRDSVQLENKFSALPFRLPLRTSLQKGLKPISKFTKKLKTSIPYIYSSYLLAYWTTVFSPRFFPRIVLHTTAMKFTLAISNLPGPVKAWWYRNSKNEKCLG